MSLIEKLSKLCCALPIGAISLLVDLVEGALASDDPERFLRRRITADAAHAAARASVEAALNASAEIKERSK